MEIDYKMVGNNIRKYRERNNLTQEELGFAIKTSAAYVSEMERAVKKPSLDKLADIAEILEMKSQTGILWEYMPMKVYQRSSL